MKLLRPILLRAKRSQLLYRCFCTSASAFRGTSRTTTIQFGRQFHDTKNDVATCANPRGQKSSQMFFSSPGSSYAASKLILYSYWQSSCSWRVRFALNLKGLPYEYRAVNIVKGEQFTPAFEKLNPLKYVPVLVDGDMVVSDSYAILLYLEEKYPSKPLLPADPQLRAINLQVASIVSSSIQPLIMLSMLKYIEDKVGSQAQLSWAQSNLEKGFLALERLLHDIAGKYATGNEVYLADVFLAPQIIIGNTRFNVDITKYDILCRIYESCEALPAFQASLPERQPDAQSR